MKQFLLKTKISSRLLYQLLTVVIIAMFSSCDNDVYELVDPPDTSGKTPIISSIEAPDSIWSGISEITIKGSNFSPVLNENIVSFDGYTTEDPEEEFAKILQATSTQLQVKVPFYIKDSTQVKVSVAHVENFSETYYLHLKSAVVEIFGDEDNKPSGITTDNLGNLYFNLEAFKVNEGLKKLSPEGTIEDFANKSGSFYLDLKYGRDDKVYGARSPVVRALFSNELGGSPKAIAVPTSTTKFVTLDFDNNYNIWAGGQGGIIYRISEDGSDKKGFAFEPRINSLRYFDGYLYAAVKKDSIQAIYKFQVVSSDSLGVPEEYFNITNNIPGLTANAITFSADGRLFIGTNAELNDPNSLIVVNPDGSYGHWYPKVVTGPILSFAWSTGNYLYYIRGAADKQNQSIVRVNMEMNGAPYYGRD